MGEVYLTDDPCRRLQHPHPIKSLRHAQNVPGGYNSPVQELFSGHGWRIMLETAKLPDGRVAKKTRAHFSDVVHIFAFNAKGELLVLREYRPFYQNYIWMLPSGLADKETDIPKAAQRELQEETGFKAHKLVFLWTGNIGEKFAQTNHFFLAKNLKTAPLPQDPEELIEVHAMPIAKALEKVLSSPVVHMPSAYGLLRYLHEKSK